MNSEDWRDFYTSCNRYHATLEGKLRIRHKPDQVGIEPNVYKLSIHEKKEESKTGHDWNCILAMETCGNLHPGRFS